MTLPMDRYVVIAGERLDPVLILAGAPTEHLLVDYLDADDLAEEVDDQFGSRQRAQVAVDDDSIEAVVDEHQQAAEQLGEEFHLCAPHVCRPTMTGIGRGAIAQGVSPCLHARWGTRAPRRSRRS